MKNKDYDFSKLATTEQLVALEEKLIGKINASEERLNGRINAVEGNILKWIIPFIITLMGMVGSIIFKLFTR